MRLRTALAIAALIALVAPLLSPPPAAAQRTVAHDTLSADTPVALTCGFCATERFGVVFRELPSPARGLEAGDFPLVLRALHLAMADAAVTGAAGSYACEGATGGGSALVDIEVWAGESPPSGDIRSLSTVDGWPTETLVWATVDAPVSLSVADAPGSSRYDVAWNRLLLEDEDGLPVRIEPPSTYLRVVVTLGAGAVASTLCDAASLDPPGGFPMRDDDGRIAPERSFIHAAGAGWYWNESPAVGVAGDWGIRLEITSLATPTDGGTPPPDAATPQDAATVADAGAVATDAAPAPDAGPSTRADDGCGCATPGRRGRASPLSAVLLLFVAVAIAARPRRPGAAPPVARPAALVIGATRPRRARFAPGSRGGADRGR